MARRSDHTPQELKSLAIKAGLEIIDQKGLKGFSARGVAAAMGYTVGTLYHIFGDLDHFMLHINADILDQWHKELHRAMRRKRKEPLRFLAHSYIDFAKRQHNRWLALFETRFESIAPLPDWYNVKIARLFSVVEDTLRPLLKDPSQTKKAAQTLWASIHGICVLSLSGKLDVVGADKPEALVDALLDTCIDGWRREHRHAAFIAASRDKAGIFLSRSHEVL